MRVARIAPRVTPCSGGKEIHVEQLTRGLASRGISQTLFYGAGGPVAGAASIKQPAQSRVGFALWAAAAVRRAHARTPFDLVHAHGDIREAWALAWLTRQLEIPAVMTIHGRLSSSELHAELRRPALSAMQAIVAVSDGVRHDLEKAGVS